MRAIIVIAIILLGVFLMAQSKIVQNPNKVTKIPYSNGFYAGNYNPDL